MALCSMAVQHKYGHVAWLSLSLFIYLYQRFFVFSPDHYNPFFDSSSSLASDLDTPVQIKQVISGTGSGQKGVWFMLSRLVICVMTASVCIARFYLDELECE